MRCVLALSLLAACGRLGFDDGKTPSDSPRAVHSALVLADPGETLTNFPILFVLDDTRVDRSAMQPDASDVRFTLDGTVLAAEIEQTEPLLAWVRVPEITGTTTVTVSYGVPPTATSTDSVWDDTFVAVYHFADTGNTASDSTGHGHVATSTKSTASAGMIGGGRAFDGSDHQSMQIDDAMDLGPTERTISAWMRETDVPAANLYHAAVTREVGTTGVDEMYLGDHNGTLFTNYICTSGNYNVPGTSAQAGTWVQLAMTADPTTVRFYIDGAQAAQQTVSGTGEHPASPIYFGADANSSVAANDDWMNGSIDEVRFENVARSPAWIKYAFGTMQDAVVTYGPIER
ncbi:MAG: hypothetical protein QM831_31685 [Kofleriaceae bacterium]